MKKTITFLLFIILSCSYTAFAQLISTSPAVLQEDSQNVIITFKSSEGSQGLKGQTVCYAHTGVITSKSSNDSDWKYAPNWCDNSAKYKCTLIGTNKFKLAIGDIRTYYGITDPTEKIKKLAFVFRNADGSKTGKTADGGDIFVEVHEAGLAMSMTSNASSNVLSAANSSVTFNVSSTQSGTIKLFLNNTSSTPIATTSGTSLSYTYNFATVGDYDVIAQVAAGGETKEATLSFCRRDDSKPVTYTGTLKQGATVNADGTVTFCLYAPQKSNVMLVGEWNNFKPTNATMMNYQGSKYFWTTVSGLDLDKEYGYYFIVDDAITVGDPYAKLVSDPWNDKYINENSLIYPNLKPFPSNVGNFVISVFKGNNSSYNWQVKDFKLPARENLVIYEILLRDFTEAKSLQGAIAKLDYIKSLGVNAVELMPVQEFSGNNSWGYNPTFYFAPDKAYGTKADYQQFVDECHARGIAVILDVVFNHTWGDHPWCKMYWDSANSRPSSNNPFFNATAPHAFSVGNDWKHENSDVQSYLSDVLKYWITEYNVDGYRFDLVKGLGDSNSYSGDYNASKYNSSRIINMKRFADAIHSVKSDGYVILEAFVDNSEEKAYTNQFNGMSWNNAGSYAQQMLGGYSSSSSFGSLNDTEHNKVSFMESHDEERNAYWASQYASSGIKGNTSITMRRLGANAALAFTSPGAKMIWEFEEMGYDESIESNGGRTDPKPTHWEYLNDKDRKGLVDCYSEIIKIRTANPDLFTGSYIYPAYEQSNWDNGRFVTIKNGTGKKEIIVAVNPTFSDKTFSYTFGNTSEKYYLNSHSYGVTPSFNSAQGKISVPAHSYVIISNMQDPSGVDEIEADKVQQNNITVFPNPSADYIYVNADEVESINVYSLTGALVANNTNSTSIDLTTIATGTYLARVSTPNGISTVKIIKK